jgi:rhodanese-related sulfurtransferase
LTSPEDVQRISPAEAKALLDSGAALLYDARTAAQYDVSHAAGAISFPEADAPARLGELPDDRDLIFYCT